MRYEMMLPHQIRAAIAANTPVVLPLGVLEYHGEHERGFAFARMVEGILPDRLARHQRVDLDPVERVLASCLLRREECDKQTTDQGQPQQSRHPGNFPPTIAFEHVRNIGVSWVAKLDQPVYETVN